MQLEKLRLIAYGPFTNCTLHLQPGLNVLYGPNEAGKSSALRAVHALLFGVEERTNDNFIHNYTQLRIGGALVDAQGQRLSCVRRKGRRSTLRDGDDDQPIDESLLQAMLGGVNAEFFTSVFGIDHQRLREGGKEVVRGEGRVGELLFAAGVVHLREKQQSLENVATELFKPSGRNPNLQFERRGRGSRKTILESRKISPIPTGRISRVARLMALAIRFDILIRTGAVSDYAELARLAHVTRARITQIMNLRLLAPDIQEAVLFLPRVESGRDPIHLRQLQAIALVQDWRKQRKLWKQLSQDQRR